MSNIDMNKARFDTQAIHAGYRRDSDYGALATPIYQTSTFTFPTADYAMRVFSGEIIELAHFSRRMFTAFIYHFTTSFQ